MSNNETVVETSNEKVESTAFRCRILPMLLMMMALWLCCSGCIGRVGQLVSQAESFTGQYTIQLQNPRLDVVKVIAEVGKSLEYQVTGLDAEAKRITLSSGASAFENMAYGLTSDASLTFTAHDAGTRIAVNVVVLGNHGTGDQEEADGLFAEFKTRLLDRLGEQGISANGGIGKGSAGG